MKQFYSRENTFSTCVKVILLGFLFFLPFNVLFSQVVHPLEDGYVRSTNPETIYRFTSDSLALNIRHQPPQDGNERVRYGYFKFEVPGSLEGKNYTATLKLYAFNNNGAGKVDFWILLAGNNWTDKTLNWNTRPSVIAQADTVKKAVLEGLTEGYIEFDVKGLIAGHEGETITLKIRHAAEHPDNVKISSILQPDPNHFPSLIFEELTVSVQGIAISHETAGLEIGQSLLLSATITPENATNKDVTWSSDQEGIATVDENGMVTAHGEGIAIITATSVDGGFAVTSTITVTNTETALVINPKEDTFVRQDNATTNYGASNELQVRYNSSDNRFRYALMKFDIPQEADNKKATLTMWGGNANAAIPALYIVLAENNWNEATTTWETRPAFIDGVTPVNMSFPYVAEYGYCSADISSLLQGKAGQTVTLVVMHSINSGENLKFASKEDPTVENRPVIVFIDVIAVTSVELDKQTAQIEVGSTIKLLATVAPSSAADKSVSWSSSDDAIATVNQNGVVTGLASGEATITVTTNDGGYSAVCLVTVSDGIPFVYQFRSLQASGLGKNFFKGENITEHQSVADMGGSTSLRNNDADNLSWKTSGYYQRNRDLGQVFIPKEDTYLQSIVLRTGPSDKAVLHNSPGAEVFIQFFEITGEPVINDNGTPQGTSATHGYTTNHRADDFIEGVEYNSFSKIFVGKLPDDLPVTYSETGSVSNLGKLYYFRLTLDTLMLFEANKRYGYIFGFFNEGDGVGITLANVNRAAVDAPPSLDDAHTPYAGGWAFRREGDGTLPPTMIPGSNPPSDPTINDNLKKEALFSPGHARFNLSPTSDGYPDVDTYRAYEFYIEKEGEPIIPPPVDECAWEFAGNENETITVDKPTYVRFGANGNYTTLWVEESIVCSYTAFGGDPAPGVLKACQICVEKVNNLTGVFDQVFSVQYSASKLLNVQSNKEINSIKVYNVLGTKLLYKLVGSHSYQINLESIPNGVYILVIDGEDSISSKKIIIQ